MQDITTNEGVLKIEVLGVCGSNVVYYHKENKVQGLIGCGACPPIL